MFLVNNLIWSEGIYILVTLIIVTIAAYFINKFLLFVSIFFIMFSIYFFRNPERNYININDNSQIVSPADGKVIDMQESEEPAFEGFYKKISIFLSPFDVHVNWIPISGKIENVIYKPGKFVFAYAPKSSEINERNDIVLTDEKSRTILVRQIAGFIARRIVCWVQPKQLVKAGEKYGMIRFGSRVDLFLPKNVILNITVGDRVYGGQTILGRWTC